MFCIIFRVSYTFKCNHCIVDQRRLFLRCCSCMFLWLRNHGDDDYVDDDDDYDYDDDD